MPNPAIPEQPSAAETELMFHDGDLVLLRDAVGRIRALAAAAATNVPDDVLCCWDTERIGGQDRVIQVRQYPEGTDDMIIALPAEPGVAEHIALWHPNVANAAAALLETIAASSLNVPADVQQAAVNLAKLLDENRDHEEPAQ